MKVVVQYIQKLPEVFQLNANCGTSKLEERYYRDKAITRSYLQRKAAEVKGFGYTYLIYGRFTEWAPLPHFGIYPKQGKANIVGAPEMLQSLTSVTE